jgi:hypothetical protein
MSSADYAIKIQVRNNRMLEQMRLTGFKSGTAVARASGTSIGVVCEFLRLERAPIKQNEQWSLSLLKIAKCLRCLPEDLFPAVHLRKPLEKSCAEFRANAADIHQISASLRLMALPADEKIMLAESKKALDQLLSKLSPRERNVIEHRFGLIDHERTLSDVPGEESNSRHNTRAIELRALGKLRRAAINDAQFRDTLGVRKPKGKIYYPPAAPEASPQTRHILGVASSNMPIAAGCSTPSQISAARERDLVHGWGHVLG